MCSTCNFQFNLKQRTATNIIPANFYHRVAGRIGLLLPGERQQLRLIVFYSRVEQFKIESADCFLNGRDKFGHSIYIKWGAMLHAKALPGMVKRS